MVQGRNGGWDQGGYHGDDSCHQLEICFGDRANQISWGWGLG